MYLEGALFSNFILPAQNPIGFSSISHFRFVHMTGTGINGMHDSARNGRICPEWPELPGILGGTGCCVFCAALVAGTGPFQPFLLVPERN
jgi:hypothetical protein